MRSHARWWPSGQGDVDMGRSGQPAPVEQLSTGRFLTMPRHTVHGKDSAYTFPPWTVGGVRLKPIRKRRASSTGREESTQN